MKPHESWTVEPHGEIEQIASNLYTVTGRLKMPLGETTRRMTIVRLADNRLVIYSAIALDAAAMAKLDSLGEVAILVVPSGLHRLDIKAWKRRYPQAQVVAPEGAKAKIEEVVPVDATAINLFDPLVKLAPVPGTGDQELSLLVEHDDGTKTLVLSDLVFNLPRLGRVAQVLYKLAGFGPGHPHQPKLVRMKLVKDEDAMRAQLRAWAEIDGLERILVAHGEPIEHARNALRELAAA
jgi:hypothetical protein